MIKKNYAVDPLPTPTTYIHITKTPAGDFKVSSGYAYEFVADSTLIIPASNPLLLANLIYGLTGTPMEESKPQDAPPKVPTPPKAEPQVSTLMDELQALSAAAIVDRVLKDTGIKITNSLKSKKAILAKAQSIYSRP